MAKTCDLFAFVSGVRSRTAVPVQRSRSWAHRACPVFCVPVFCVDAKRHAKRLKREVTRQLAAQEDAELREQAAEIILPAHPIVRALSKKKETPH